MPAVFDPFFACPPKIAMPYGASPFRARGVVYGSDLARIARGVPGGLEAVLAAADDPPLAAFFRQTFHPSSWYDALPLAVLSRVCARVRGVSFVQYLREAASDYARVALDGFSGVVLRRLSHETIALWMPRMSAWFNDFGEMRTHRAAEGFVRAERTGLPRYVVLGYTLTATEFAEEVLRRAGARDVRAHPLSAEPEAARAGVDLYRVTFEIRWSA